MPYKDKDYGRAQKRAYEKAHRKEARARSKKFYYAHTEEYLAWQKEYRKNNIEAQGIVHRKNRYGLTHEEYNFMFISQGGRCAICGIHQDDLTQKLCVDHDHETGFIRGLLCRRCNSGIGLLQDSGEILRNALKYIEVRE